MTSFKRSTIDNESGFDIVGDVHGQATLLKKLLKQLGYSDTFKHKNRRVVFVGDLVDRGPHQVEVLQIARQMEQQGSAIVVAGNHELNAIAWVTPNPGNPGQHFRVHDQPNRTLHTEFLNQVGEGSNLHEELVQWFLTMPLWFEQDGLRVVHACWHQPSIDEISDNNSGNPNLNPELFGQAMTEGTSLWNAVRTITRGPEAPISTPCLTKTGRVRHTARFRWWDPEAYTEAEAVLLPESTVTPDGLPYPTLPSTPVAAPIKPYLDQVPVVFGHYWFREAPAVCSPYTACVDYSAGGGGPLVAYRWSGESSLDSDRLVATDKT